MDRSNQGEPKFSDAHILTKRSGVRDGAEIIARSAWATCHDRGGIEGVPRLGLRIKLLRSCHIVWSRVIHRGLLA